MRILPTGRERRTITAARWGLAGSGVLYYCPSDNTVLLLERSENVEDPGLWGIPGGAVGDGSYSDDVDSPDFPEDVLRDRAFTEAEEELGHLPEHDREEGSHTVRNNKFPYTTFLAVVTPQQKMAISRNIQLNWESNDFQWFRADFLPENIHPGVVAAVNQLILSKRQRSRQLQLAI
jgi:8-oxo-dGTP pyrophosphatase MutT (NUDIX family)